MSIALLCIEMHSGGGKRLTQARALERPQLPGSSPMMDDAALRRQRRIDEMLGVEELKSKDADVKDEDQVMQVIDVAEPAATTELGPQVVEKMSKVREAM